MSIAHAPSKLAWRARELMRARLVDRIPFLRAYYERRQVDETYELAMRAASRNFAVKVLDHGWANQGHLEDKKYEILTSELVKISKMIEAFVGGIPVALHWSRQYEYPYAIMNSMPSEHPPKDFKILDCGASRGPLQFYLAMKGFEVHTLDLDLGALERVARFKLKKGLTTLYPNYGNIFSLPFPDNHFDRVLNISVLEHAVYHIERDIDVILKGFLNELLRVLKPNGLVVLTFDVNMNPKKSDRRLYFHEYESLCGILGILPTPPPPNRLSSSDTREGRTMGEDLYTYCAVLTHDLLKEHDFTQPER